MLIGIETMTVQGVFFCGGGEDGRTEKNSVLVRLGVFLSRFVLLAMRAQSRRAGVTHPLEVNCEGKYFHRDGCIAFATEARRELHFSNTPFRCLG